MVNESSIFNNIKPDPRNLNERIYAYLQNKIMYNQLKPGSRINYDQLIEELGVSKTPLRDALNLLQQDGLIEIKPRSGTFVKMPNAKDIIEIFDVRKSLERQAIGIATKRIPRPILEELLEQTKEADKCIQNEDFKGYIKIDYHLHKTIFLYSENRRLIQILQSLQTQVVWIGSMTGRTTDYLKEANEWHKNILLAMMDSDVQLAQNLMEEHIEKVKEAALLNFI